MVYEPRPRAGRRLLRAAKKLAKWVFGLVVLVLVGLYSYVRYDFSSAASELEARMEEARELGLPLTPEDMKRQPPVKEEDNAAAEYRAAFAQAEREEDLFLPIASCVLDGAYRPGSSFERESREGAGALSFALRSAAKASQMPKCDFGRNWDLGSQLLFPEFSKMKSLAKWLDVRGVLAARDGDFDRAVEDLRAALRISGHAGEDQLLIAGLVRLAIEAAALQAIEVAASHQPRNRAFLKKARQLLEELPPAPDVKWYLEGEVFFGYHTARHLSRYDDRSLDEGYDMIHDGLGWRIFPPLIERDLAERGYASQCLGYWNQAFRTFRDSSSKASDIGAAMDRAAAEMANNWRPSLALSAILFPVFSQAGNAFEKLKLNRETTKGMIDVLRFKLKHGRLPKTLEEAGIHILDPFSGERVKYRITSTGFRIYGVGFDGKDDGGLFQWEKPYEKQRTKDEPISAFPAWVRTRPIPKPEAAKTIPLPPRAYEGIPE